MTGKVIIFLLGLSLIVERVTEKILYLLPASRRRIYAWAVSLTLGLLITFIFRFGIIRELGLTAQSRIACWLDYGLSGVLVATGSEPVHSLIDALAWKRDELKRRANNV